MFYTSLSKINYVSTQLNRDLLIINLKRKGQIKKKQARIAAFFVFNRDWVVSSMVGYWNQS